MVNVRKPSLDVVGAVTRLKISLTVHFSARYLGFIVFILRYDYETARLLSTLKVLLTHTGGYMQVLFVC